MVANTVRRFAGRSKGNLPGRIIPAIIVIYSCMLPREFTVELLSVAFQPYRVVLTILLPVTIYLAIRDGLKGSFIDLLMVLVGFWFILALNITENFESGIITGSSDALNMGLAYFTGRVAVRSSGDVRAIVFASLPGLLICALLIASESLAGHPIIRPFAAQIAGVPYTPFGLEERWGLMRAAGPFPHPILAGVFMSSFLPLVWVLTEKKPALRAIGLTAVGSFFFSLSSTGFVAFIAGSGLLIAHYLQKVTKLPVFAAGLTALIFLMVFIKLFSSGGLFPWIVTHLTFDPGTGYYRLSIWTYAGAEVKNNPIFGIGTRNYVRPFWMRSASVDSYWLVLALRYGIPASATVFLIMACASFSSFRGMRSPFPLDQRVGYALGFSLIAIIFTGWSVYLWEGVAIWMILLTGMAVSFGLRMATIPRRAKQSSRATGRARAPVRKQRWPEPVPQHP